MSFGRRQQPPGTRPSRAGSSPPLQPVAPGASHTAEAAKSLIALLLATYTHGGTVHAETVIGAAAALAGEFAQRAADPSEPYAINDILFEGAARGRPTMWACIEQAATDADVPSSDRPDPATVLKRIDSSGAVFPPVTVPERHYPLEHPSACVRLRPRVIDIADRFDLSRRDLAFALGMATAGLIERNGDDLPPAVAIRLAAEIMFGRAMAPLAEAAG
jgi:hypothetical protein